MVVLKRIDLSLLSLVIFGFVGHAHTFQTTTEPKNVPNFDYKSIYGMVSKLVLMEHEISALRKVTTRQESKIDRLEYELRVAGSTYTRWGRTVCPGNGTSFVYSGYMAGSNKGHPGTGSNYLCLAGDPLWDHFEDAIESYGKITGVEYQFWHHKSNGAADFLGDNMYNHNPPCAVCHSRRSVSIMIPGRNQCYDGWTKEYSGYLVSGYYGDASATEYVCLDRRPEKVVCGKADDEDNRLYFVEGMCGKSLACPPYVNGREITCVVCSL